ncbi:MAG: wax ester/triacylglycerol synthase family O-acyltransferase [Luteimonas sp.]
MSTTKRHTQRKPEEIHAKRNRREAMSRVDTAWLRMERPTNPMMITGVLMLAEPMPLTRLKHVVRTRFLDYARFRQKAVDTAAGASWRDDEHFDLDWHVQPAALPGRGDKRISEKQALERYVSQLASSPLDKSKPLWQFHLVEHYQGGSALVARIHHSYADGIALVQVLLSLTDTMRQPGKTALAKTWLQQDGAKVARRVGAVERYAKLGGKVLEKGIEMYRDPTFAGVLAKEGGEIARELVHALALPDDPPSLLRGKLGIAKRVAWAEPLDLDEVKAVGRACDCTVNDVLMAAAAGALRDYMLERGEANLSGMTLRATVPVNLRPLEHAKKLGNHFGLVFLDLPVGEPNPIRRVERVAECMNQLKKSRQAIVAYGLLAALGMAPQPLQELALELFSRKATTVATNVPGPQQPLYLGGCTVREMMFWVPQTGSIGIGISILSYNGHVHFGLIADAKLVPDPDAVIRRFRPEFEKLLYLALMGNWDYALDAVAAERLL